MFIEFVDPSVRIETAHSTQMAYNIIESAARTCYKSEDKISDGSAEKLIKFLLDRGHMSVFEHVTVSVRFIFDRAISQELRTHRIASFSQESTRYCNYSGAMQFIIPRFLSDQIKPIAIENPHESIFRMFKGSLSVQAKNFLYATVTAAAAYSEMIKAQEKPENARCVLPLGLKTETVMTANLREWIHVFKMRNSRYAHPDMRYLMEQLYDKFNGMYPLIFPEVNNDL